MQNLGTIRHLFSLRIQSNQGPNWRQPSLYPLDHEPDAKTTAWSESQQEPGVQVSRHDPNSTSVAKESKGQNTRGAELKELPLRAFSIFREKI